MIQPLVLVVPPPLLSSRWLTLLSSLLPRVRALGPRSLVLAVLISTACGTTKPPLVDFSSARRDYGSTDYPEVYQRWTRHEKVVSQTESALEMWATFRSLDFRDAFVAHYAEAYALNAADRDRLLQAQRDAAGAAYEFLITAQSANYRWNDLEKKSSPWRVTLRDGAGDELEPDELRVEKLPDMFEREFYPAKTPFTKTYFARFSRTPDQDAAFEGERTGSIVLRFAGPLGHADLRWDNR